jgi:hypothetical protein
MRARVQGTCRRRDNGRLVSKLRCGRLMASVTDVARRQSLWRGIVNKIHIDCTVVYISLPTDRHANSESM